MRLQFISGCTSDAISKAERGRSKAVGNLREAPRQSQGSGGTERIWEPDRVRREKWVQESQRVMEDKEDKVFPHQIVDFAPVAAPPGKYLGDKVMIKLRE